MSSTTLMMETDVRLEFRDQVKNLPSEIAIVKHVHDRITELKKLYNDVAKIKDKLVHQMLPNHMRRRAMSHNPKRLPLKYRNIHINQMEKSGPISKKKRPSRKYRRKPRNLMMEYERRKKRSGVWLETHIWHAKRYHMKELWGYKIPYSSTDKRYRASYRAAANHCLLQDISYIAAIELSGPVDQLKMKLDMITSRDAGLSFTAKCYMNGTRAGKVELFKANQYPYGAICPVDFLWRHDDSTEKTLWIFVHPTTYQEVLKELILLFEMKNEKYERMSDIKFITRNDATVRNPKYVNDATKVSLIELKSTLNRLRLTGPFSNAVLLKALKPTESDANSWLSKLFETNMNFHNSHDKQLDFWNQFKSTKSPSEIPPNSIMNVNVIDPRANRPPRRVISKNNDSITRNDEIDILDIHSTVSHSPIWSKELRDRITKEMLSTGELCKLRNKQQLVPGIAASFENDLQPIPILIVQRPGLSNNRLSFGSGFDLIVPAGYGLSVWLSLIRCGAKSGGWRETETIASEMSEEVFLPDTLAGRKEELRRSNLKREEYFRKPTNKRINYRKMSIVSPFLCPWKQLILEWGGGENFYVLRNRLKLDKLQRILKGKEYIDPDLPHSALIPVNLIMNGRGVSTENGIICLPSKRDIKTFLLKKSLRDKGPVFFEPDGIDVDENTRKMMRINHKKLLKRLRNRRVRTKKKLQSVSQYRVQIPKSSTEKLISEQHEKICELWLPKQPQTVRKQCSRQVIGYVTSSRFNFTEGKVCSIGYLTRNGFEELIETFNKFKCLQPFVLTRASNSKSYSVTNLSIN